MLAGVSTILHAIFSQIYLSPDFCKRDALTGGGCVCVWGAGGNGVLGGPDNGLISGPPTQGAGVVPLIPRAADAASTESVGEPTHSESPAVDQQGGGLGLRSDDARLPRQPKTLEPLAVAPGDRVS